jgi:hypothetical protein
MTARDEVDTALAKAKQQDIVKGFDAGSEESTVLSVYCPLKGPSLRRPFVTMVMMNAGYDVVARPVTKEMCGSNPVHIVLDEWPRIAQKGAKV